MGDGRLAPQHEAVVIAMTVFAATNILLSMNQAQQIRLIVIEEGEASGGLSVQNVGERVADLLRQAGLGFDSPELPFIAAEAIRAFSECLDQEHAAAVVKRIVNMCKVRRS